MNDVNPTQQKFVVALCASASTTERAALNLWAEKLLDIRNMKISSLKKSKLAIDLTLRSNIIWPTVKAIAKNTTKFAWAERSGWQKWAMGGIAIGAAVFGGKQAGIAALGTAIGVPLWVVLGGGAAFAKLLIDATRSGQTRVPAATYTVIDAERVDPPKK